MKTLLTLVCTFYALLARSSPAAEPRPNIIFILSDDVGLGNISCYGGHFKTPNIDSLAAGGTRFKYCYANPLCSPSRATCLTGRYVFRTGVLTNHAATLRKDEIMLQKVLKPAGYVTAQVGKWALGWSGNSEWGFDEYLRFKGSGKYWSSQVRTYTENGKKKQLGERYLPDVMHEFLVDFITRHKGQPFYVYYAMSHVHTPILRTPDSKPDSNDFYEDNNAYMDKLVGQLAAALDKLGLREKTLLVFAGDNGTGRVGATEATVDGRAISGMKFELLEGGSRVPLIVNWKGTTPAGKVLDDLVDFSDMFPTFVALGGAKLPEGVTIDGHSFAPQLRGEKGTPREWVFVQLGNHWYVREQGWKLTDDGALFDMTDAPFVEKPVPADAQSDAASAARQRLQAVLAKLDPGAGKPASGEVPINQMEEEEEKEGIIEPPVLPPVPMYKK